MVEQALSDVKVLDLTWYIAGPYCTKLLADYGAEVTKVERPGTGDPARHLGPFLGDDPHPERSGLFLHLNTNKQSVTLNLKTEMGRYIFSELVKDADILVESFSPRVMPGLGLDYSTLEKINPKLVMTYISNFGQTGPYRDFKASELTIDAMGHTMITHGLPDREPLKRGENCLLYQAGLIAAVATMGAFLVSRQQGIGQQVDVSLMETQAGNVDYRLQNLVCYSYSGYETPRVDIRLAGLSILPYGVYPCKDGAVQFIFHPPWRARFCQMVGMSEAEFKERFPDELDFSRKDELTAIFLNWTMQRTKLEVMREAQAARCPGTAVYTPGDLVHDPHFQGREFWVDLEHPVAGKLTYPGAPFDSEQIPWKVRLPAPLLGQHNREVYYQKFGYRQDELIRLREMGVI